MCKHFDFDVGSISRSRESPYITLLSSLVEVHSSKEVKFRGELPTPPSRPPPPTPGGRNLVSCQARALNLNKDEANEVELVNESLLVIVTCSCWKRDCNLLLYVSPLSTSFEKQKQNSNQKHIFVLTRLSLLWDGTYLLKYYRSVFGQRKCPIGL